MKRIRPAVCKHIQDKWLNVSSRASSFWNVIPKTDMAVLVATLKHYIHAAERAAERPSAKALASGLFWDLCSPFLWKTGVFLFHRNISERVFCTRSYFFTNALISLLIQLFFKHRLGFLWPRLLVCCWLATASSQYFNKVWKAHLWNTSLNI